jgi:hypothetical protein
MESIFHEKTGDETFEGLTRRFTSKATMDTSLRELSRHAQTNTDAAAQHAKSLLSFML